LDSIGRAYKEGADLGVSVHVVNEGVDEGPVIVQRRCLKQPKENGYSLDRSELIVHIDEQRLLREAILKWNP
jgi:folate-dependent phosphoribosylglycinamide formyltransferase PurN